MPWAAATVSLWHSGSSPSRYGFAILCCLLECEETQLICHLRAWNPCLSGAV